MFCDGPFPRSLQSSKLFQLVIAETCRLLAKNRHNESSMNQREDHLWFQRDTLIQVVLSLCKLFQSLFFSQARLIMHGSTPPLFEPLYSTFHVEDLKLWPRVQTT